MSYPALSASCGLDQVLKRLETAEKHWDKLVPLQLRRPADGSVVTMKKSNTAESFTRKFFEKFYKEFNTTYGSGLIATPVNRRRSVEDIYRIASCYLGKKIRLKDILNAIWELNFEKKTIGSNFCYQIEKRVYMDRSGRNSNGVYYDATKADELGLMKCHYELLYQTKAHEKV